MARTRSADEVLADNIAAMGPDLGKVFTVLSNELTFLSWKFQELSELYGGDGRRHDVMNESAPFFFWMLQRSWWDDSLLGVTRLLPPKESGPPKPVRQANLTFRRLPDLISDGTLRQQVTAKVDAAVARATFATDWRNKRIAHFDLDHSLDQAPTPLPPASLGDVREVLGDLADILNLIENHYFSGSSTLYLHSPITHGVMTLLYTVRHALSVDRARQERLERGDIRPDDWLDSEPPL